MQRLVASPKCDSQLVVGSLQHVSQRRQVAPVLLQRHTLSFPGVRRRRQLLVPSVGCAAPIARLRSPNVLVVIFTGANHWD
jgi:hypothetical protein